MFNNTTLLIIPLAAAGWGVVEIGNLLTAIAGGLLNTIVLIVFVTHRAYTTPFTIYLLNLLIANFMETGLAKLASALLNAWPPFRTDMACNFYLFSNYIAMAGMINTHLLISFNRLWAVILPHSYKNHHTKTLAMGICAGMWLYIMAIVLPLLILDLVYYRLPFAVHGRCMINNDKQPVYYLTMLMVVYIIPEVVILFTFPVIWRKRQKHRQIVNKTTSQQATQESQGQSIRGATKSGSESSKSQRKNMQVLLILMVSMIVCWTPLMGATIATCFVNFKDRTFFGITTFLFAAEAITDPILFGLVFNKTSVKEMWNRVTKHKC